MDSKQIDELFARTLSGNYDDDLPWDAVRALRLSGDRDVCQRAAEWCHSDKPLNRARGADILAQLGKTVEHPYNNFPEESFAVIATLATREKDELPLISAVHALGHMENPAAIPLVIEHWLHPNPNVRFAVACALGNFANDPRSVETLLALTRDPNADVRDWATFGLGTQCKLDSKGIRDALFDRLTDPDSDVRGESLVGLAKRQDQRALPALVAELVQPGTVSDRAFEAAEAFLCDGPEISHRDPTVYAAAIKQRFAI